MQSYCFAMAKKNNYYYDVIADFLKFVFVKFTEKYSFEQ